MAELLGFAFLNAKAFLVLSPLTLLPQKWCVGKLGPDLDFNLPVIQGAKKNEQI